MKWKRENVAVFFLFISFSLAYYGLFCVKASQFFFVADVERTIEIFSCQKHVDLIKQIVDFFRFLVCEEEQTMMLETIFPMIYLYLIKNVR